MREHFRKMAIGLPVVLLSMVCLAVAQTDEIRDPRYSAWLAKKPPISQINIDGNKYFSVSKIKAQLYARENSFWQALRAGSRERALRYTINRDTLGVKYLYLREGFLNVRVHENFTVSPKDSTAILNLHIDEGSHFLVGRVFLDTDSSVPFYGNLQGEVGKLKTGDPVDPIKINEMIFNIKAVFANNGYPYARIEQTIDSSTATVNSTVTFVAQAGPLVRFGSVRVKGLKHYRSYLVRREIAFKEGELYSRKKLIESQKHLYATGLFNAINLEINRSDSTVDSLGLGNAKPDFSFSAIERRPHFISVNTGAAQDPQQDLIWDMSASWGKRNIFISRRLELSADSRFIIFSQWRLLNNSFQIKYTEPWFFNIRMPLTFTGRYEPGVRSQLQNYRIQKWGISVSTRKEWSEELYALFSGEYEAVNIYGVSPQVAAAIRDSSGISIRRKLNVTLVRDTRLDKFVPKSGSYSTFFGQYVGGILGGDDSFFKLECSWARYQQAVGPFIYATRLKGGWVKEMNGSHSVPNLDRFQLGGANSIRGFKENSIGPRSANGSPTIDSTNIGANVYAIFNQELRFPIIWRFWGSVFTDMGNGWESFSDVSPESILFSYGTGLQFLSPAGPIRLDYAHHLENGIYPEDDRFHVTVLYAF